MKLIRVIEKLRDFHGVKMRLLDSLKSRAPRSELQRLWRETDSFLFRCDMGGLIDAIDDLSSMIGMSKEHGPCDQAADMLLLWILENGNPEGHMFHMMGTGPPGVGKTTFFEKLGRVISKMRVLCEGDETPQRPGVHRILKLFRLMEKKGYRYAMQREMLWKRSLKLKDEEVSLVRVMMPLLAVVFGDSESDETGSETQTSEDSMEVEDPGAEEPEVGGSEKREPGAAELGAEGLGAEEPENREPEGTEQMLFGHQEGRSVDLNEDPEAALPEQKDNLSYERLPGDMDRLRELVYMLAPDFLSKDEPADEKDDKEGIQMVMNLFTGDIKKRYGDDIFHMSNHVGQTCEVMSSVMLELDDIAHFLMHEKFLPYGQEHQNVLKRSIKGDYVDGNGHCNSKMKWHQYCAPNQPCKFYLMHKKIQGVQDKLMLASRDGMNLQFRLSQSKKNFGMLFFTVAFILSS